MIESVYIYHKENLLQLYKDKSRKIYVEKNRSLNEIEYLIEE